MSRREDRFSESKRHRSRFDREPSPKKYRRDGKPETERPPAEPDLNKDRPDRDHRHHRRLQDPLPLESGNMSKESEKGLDGLKGVAPTKVPQSRSYFQHDDRGSAGQNGRGFSRRTDSERGWWHDPKEQRNDRSINKTVSVETQQKDEKSKDNREGSHTWRHDGYFEMEGNPKPPARRRPAFREQKIPADPEKTNRAADDPVMPNPQDHAIGSGRRNERGHNYRYSDRPERPVAGEREFNKAGNISSGDRFSGNSRYRGRDRFPTARQGYHSTGGGVDKWKHDLYDEANKSPPPKNEEDQISKIEALLAS
ncbi:hypothetical protein C2S53_006493 [Perilla frutescens var. hirtella]|uniref:Btz domain-containing protein n=1 Tax=Perilla frutescens var. hirtella TaxID=608512 RepID=A0AAD4P2C5_PERFH|nr:hypothetical protein C2S53_006493 [Perilla frutescens var. hirtella]